jgi:hypothetical protein
VDLPPDQQDYHFDLGERFRFTFQNQSGKELYVTLFDIGPDGSIAILYPEKGQQVSIRGGQVVIFPARAAQGEDSQAKVLETCGLPGYESFKVIATTEPTGPNDFAFLEQTGVVRARSTEMGKIADWTTSQLNFVLSDKLKAGAIKE